MGQYILLFFEGVLAFISPCILPLLPIYLTYLSGQSGKRGYVINVIGFILGFTIVFVSLGASATFIGSFLNAHLQFFKKLSGIIIILMGLNYLNIIKIHLPSSHKQNSSKTNVSSTFIGAVAFGISLSFSWTACIGTFLGSALLLAANSSTVSSGILMLLVFSMGFSIPFFISAVIFSKMSGAISFIKKNYDKVIKFSGIFLIVIGLAMFFNVFGYWERLFY
jgi:Cytochrome c biogenesis protein